MELRFASFSQAFTSRDSCFDFVDEGEPSPGFDFCDVLLDDDKVISDSVTSSGDETKITTGFDEVSEVDEI